MLNHSTTSIQLEKQNEKDDYASVDTSKAKYSRQTQKITYRDTEGREYSFAVLRRKETYLTGGWIAKGEGMEFDAYTLNGLKAKIVEYIEF